MDNWDRLLEKYFEGQTNLEEEERLKIYINGSETSENHKPYRMLFVDHDWNSLPTMDADPFSKIDFNIDCFFSKFLFALCFGIFWT